MYKTLLDLILTTQAPRSSVDGKCVSKFKCETFDQIHWTNIICSCRMKQNQNYWIFLQIYNYRLTRSNIESNYCQWLKAVKHIYSGVYLLKTFNIYWPEQQTWWIQIVDKDPFVMHYLQIQVYSNHRETG